MSEDRALNNRELISTMSGMDEKERSISEKINDFLRAIAQTKQQGVQCKEEVSCFLVKKKEIKEGPGKSE